jgi:hypothetical protein
MPETLVYRRDNVAHHIDEASREFVQGLPAAALRSLADARDSLNVAIAETVYVALDPQETAEPLMWEVVAHALHLSVEDARERYESYCRRRAY